MWWRAIRLGGHRTSSNAFHAGARLFSSLSTAHNTPLIISQLTRELGLKNEGSILFTINRIAAARGPEDFANILPKKEQDSPDFARWVKAATAPDLHNAVERFNAASSDQIGDRQITIADSNSVPDMRPPTWLVLHLLRSKVRSLEDAKVGANLALKYGPSVPPLLQPFVLIVTVHWLVHFHFSAPLRRVVLSFLALPTEVTTAYQFNLLLRTLSGAPGSREMSSLVATVLQPMGDRNLAVCEEAYDALLRDHFITLGIVFVVEKIMEKHNYKPTLQHLKAMLRVSARQGHWRRAGRYVSMIRYHLLTQPGASVPYGPHPRNHSHPRIRLTRFDTYYMASFRDLQKLFWYIDRVAKVEKWPSHRLPKHLSPVPTPLLENGLLHEGPNRQSADNQLGVSDWTAALNVASRDKNTSAEDLLKMFRQGFETLGFRPSMFTYSVTIRGLLYKWDTKHAAELWREARKHGFPLDTVSVANGVSALTLDEDPYSAFALLEEVHSNYLSKYPQKHPSSATRNGRHRGAIGHLTGFAKVDLYVINQFMTSLQRMGRADVVFALWENMQTLYGISPDAITLNIILKTARWAKKISGNSLRGALAQLGLGRLVRRSHSHDPQETYSDVGSREQAFEKIASLVNPAQRRPSLTGLWHREPASQVALRVALDMFFSNWPELSSIQSPVRALRHSIDSPAKSPMSDMIHSMMGGVSSEGDPGAADSITWRSKPCRRYASILPTDVTFRAYIELLSAESHQAEIPRVLAWMRELQVEPSRVTLATALVCWAQVSMDAPLIEAMKGGAHRSQYEKLKGWLAEWVGQKMPSDAEIGNEMRRLNHYQEANYLEIIAQRIRNTEYDRDQVE